MVCEQSKDLINSHEDVPVRNIWNTVLQDEHIPYALFVQLVIAFNDAYLENSIPRPSECHGIKTKSEAYSHTGQLDFCNWLTTGNTTG